MKHWKRYCSWSSPGYPSPTNTDAWGQKVCRHTVNSCEDCHATLQGLVLSTPHFECFNWCRPFHQQVFAVRCALCHFNICQYDNALA